MFHPANQPPMNANRPRSGKIAGHPDQVDGGGVIERPALARGPEAASVVQRDRPGIRDGYPESEPARAPSSRPAGDRIDERGADTVSARLGGDEHPDELRPRIVGYVGVTRQAGGDAEPSAVVLGDERDAVDA